MNMWTFYDFQDRRGVNTFRQWLDTLPANARAKINARLLFMRAIHVWPEQYISALKGWPGLVELRIVCAGTQYRPLGFYGPGPRREFTLLLGAVEKGRLPKRVLEAADGNRKIALADATRICEHEFD
jgi:hypothetical protein